MIETVYDLPVIHLFSDGSVSDVRVKQFDTSDSPHIGYAGYGGDDIISLGSADHARALAHALLIAADLTDKHNKKPL